MNRFCAYTNKLSYFPNERILLYINDNTEGDVLVEGGVLDYSKDYSPSQNVSINEVNGNIELSTNKMLSTPGIQFKNINFNKFTLEMEYDTESSLSFFFYNKKQNFHRWRKDDLTIGQNKIFKKTFNLDFIYDIEFYLLFSMAPTENNKSITIKSIKITPLMNANDIHLEIYDIKKNKIKETKGISIKQNNKKDPAISSCDWIPSTYIITPDLISGLYFIKLTNILSTIYYLPLIIKNNRYDNKLLVISNTNTWNAYNTWNGDDGGLSFYSQYQNNDINSRFLHGTRTVKRLTFHRPLATISNEIASWMNNNPYNQKKWSHLLYNESLMYLFLLDNSINYDLINDYDMHTLNIDKYKNYKMIMMHGHPEYWSENALINLNKLAQNGTNIGYFGGNGLYWKTEFLNKNLIECRKDYTEHEFDLKKGGVWKNLKLENENYLTTPKLLGIWCNSLKYTFTEFENFHITNNHFILQGVDNEFGKKTLSSRTDADGEGISGWEVDDTTLTPEYNKYKIATAPNGGDILYIPKGSELYRENFNTFSGGTILWNFGLFTDEGISKLTLNVINNFTS